MSDCSNAEIRDRLPDLLHERLDANARAAVLAHVETCADCRAELGLLRETRVALSSGARSVDVAAIARRVVARTSVRPRSASALRRRTWTDWRIAASVALIAIGGASLAAIRMTQRPGRVDRPPSVATPGETVTSEVPKIVPVPLPSRPPAVAVAPVTPAQNAELSAAGGVSDLSDSDLQMLLEDLRSIDAIPLTEPDPVTVRVAVPGTGSFE